MHTVKYCMCLCMGECMCWVCVHVGACRLKMHLSSFFSVVTVIRPVYLENYTYFPYVIQTWLGADGNGRVCTFEERFMVCVWWCVYCMCKLV